MLDWIISGLIAVSAIGFGWFSHSKIGTVREDQRPHQIPWGLVMVACAFVFFLVIVHMLNLIGVDTGPGKGLFG